MEKEKEPIQSEKSEAKYFGPSREVPLGDDWESEHPLLMTKLPNDPESNPSLSALLQMVHEDGTPEERAENWKEHGNDSFKLGKEQGYRDAVQFYSQALDVRLNDNAKNSLLFTNRAAAHLQLRMKLW